MNEALVHAGDAELWERPGKASWTSFVEQVITRVAWALDDCWECRMLMSDGSLSPAQEDEIDRRRWAQRELGTGNLVSTCLQGLVLFASTVAQA